MNRRNFLKNTSLAAVAVTSFTGTSCTKPAVKQQEKEVESEANPDNFLLNEITLDELQEKMKSGLYSSRTITELYLKRISELDRKGPKLNAVIELNKDALSIADQMDRERKSGTVRGPLHGIPVLIKDNIDTGDSMMTTAGSLALLGHKARKDAFVVKKLRAAGAVILGKTNLSEWANFRSTHSASGWSSRGGQTRNPFVLDRSACGSSSGSAVAVSANLCALAIGTETDGSIIAPSSFCGIVGIKPTVGLWSRSGIIPISKTQDTPGPMARTVKDAASLLWALTGVDQEDIVTAESNGKVLDDYSLNLDKNGLRRKRIGIESSFLEGNFGVVNLFQKAIDQLKQEGAEVIEVQLMKHMNEIGDAEVTVLQFEFKEGLNQYLKNASANVYSLAEVIAFNQQNQSQAMPYFKQEILESSEKRKGIDSKEYADALTKTLRSRSFIDEILKRDKLDAICGPSIGLPCAIDPINGDYDTGFYFCQPAAMAGYPHITVPMGQVHELPVGLSFFSGAYQESLLIQMAYAYEQASAHRRVPKFIKTLIPDPLPEFDV